jgi:hypothetical protein
LFGSGGSEFECEAAQKLWENLSFCGETIIRAHFALKSWMRLFVINVEMELLGQILASKIFAERCQDIGVHHSKKAILY